MTQAQDSRLRRPLRNSDRGFLLLLLGEAYDQRAWHGPNLRGAIRRVDADQASWHPAPGRHSIAEIIVHCAYWKYTVRRRLRGDKRGSFNIKGSNWFLLPRRLSVAQWAEYVRLLEGEHAALIDAVASTPPSTLEAVLPGKTMTLASRVYGVAFHDVYHAGQIQTIKALQKSLGKF